MITLNPNIRPANRARALDIVRGMFEENQTEELEALFKYFLPSPPKTPKTAFQWVASAVADKKHDREYLRYVYADGTRIAGTDGHRLHIANDDRDAGYYDPKSGLPVDYVGDYAPIDKIIPDTEPNTPVDVDICETRLITDNGKEFPIAKIETAWVNEQYLRKAVANGARVAVTAPNKPIKGRNKFGTFVIIPIRDE